MQRVQLGEMFGAGIKCSITKNCVSGTKVVQVGICSKNDEGFCRLSNVVVVMVMRSSEGHHDVVACCQCGWTLPVDTSPVGSVVVLVPNGKLVASM